MFCLGIIESLIIGALALWYLNWLVKNSDEEENNE